MRAVKTGQDFVRIGQFLNGVHAREQRERRRDDEDRQYGQQNGGGNELGTTKNKQG
jgi:hypothetical protein